MRADCDGGLLDRPLDRLEYLNPYLNYSIVQVLLEICDLIIVGAPTLDTDVLLTSKYLNHYMNYWEISTVS